MNSLFLFLVMVYTGLFFDNMHIFRFALIASVIHEVGHILAYRYVMKKWPRIDISVFGFRMRNNVTQPDFLLFVLISGPLVNLFTVILAIFFSWIHLSFDLVLFGIVNLIIFIFNILPVYYLDGGQILCCLSPFYQRNHHKISVFTVVLLSVMLMYFTDNKTIIFIPLVYFIANILNDV